VVAREERVGGCGGWVVLWVKLARPFRSPAPVASWKISQSIYIGRTTGGWIGEGRAGPLLGAMVLANAIGHGGRRLDLALLCLCCLPLGAVM
jgi:hypothetical protein